MGGISISVQRTKRGNAHGELLRRPPHPPPPNHHHTPPNGVDGWSVLAFPLARLSCSTTPKSRQLASRNAAEEGAAHGVQTGRLLFFLPSLPTPPCQLGWTEKPPNGLEREPDSMAVSSIQQRRQETSSINAVSIQTLAAGRSLSLSILSPEKKMSWSKKKEVPLRPCMGAPTLKINMGIGTPLSFPPARRP